MSVWTGWVIPDELVQAPFASVWPDGADLDGDTAEMFLASARAQCVAFAPAPTGTEDAPVPQAYRLAQVMQARALWRSGKSGSNDQIGGDGFTVTVFPMDWTVKRLLRPQSGLVIA